MNKWSNILYQTLGHVPFIIIGLFGIYNGLFYTMSMPLKALSIIAGGMIIFVMIPSLYIGLTQNEYY